MKKLNKGIVFTSQNNNKYFYDDVTGHIVHMEDEDNDLLDRLNKYRDIRPENKIQNIEDVVTAEDVKEYLFIQGNGFKQLILEVTTKCNFRCKYCTYSDNYEFTRTHGNGFMTFDVAKMAVDYYMKNFEAVYNRNPGRKPIISFYGGEPLLNFELIKKVVNYLNISYKKYRDDIQLHTTTNGLLLSDDVQDFLYKNNFNVLVSIDGYKENHDRNRVLANGVPTFDKVYDNYIRFKKRYPKQSIYISACYDFKTDMNKFAENADSMGIEVLRASMISNSDKYYSQFSQKDKETFAKNCNKIKNNFFKKAVDNELTKGNFLYNFFVDVYGSFAYHRMIGESLPKIRPCTSTCVPGEKIYVESDGNFIVCEKINNKKKIGSVYQGLDCEKISRILEEYNKALLKYCKNCNITKFCTLCFKDFCCGESFNYDKKICDTTAEAIKQLLLDYTNLLEQNPKLFEEITTDYYSRLNAMGDII